MLVVLIWKNKFRMDSEGNELDTLIRLMSYYEVPYMSVLIRCCELGLHKENTISEKLLNVEKKDVRDKFIELWLDNSILEATKKDDYNRLEDIVKRFGDEYIRGSYLNERVVKKVLKNMQTLYSEIKGE